MASTAGAKWIARERHEREIEEPRELVFRWPSRRPAGMARALWRRVQAWWRPGA